jgi:hypothetical protein
MNKRNESHLTAMQSGQFVAVEMNDGTYKHMTEEAALAKGHGPWIVREFETFTVYEIGQGYANTLGHKLA